MWQDFVFLVGSSLSIVFLTPTLRDSDAQVPFATSFPSMAIGLVYGMTFVSLGMTFSAVGSFSAGTMWCLIALLRSPPRFPDAVLTRPERVRLFVGDAQRWGHRKVARRSAADRYAAERGP